MPRLASIDRRPGFTHSGYGLKLPLDAGMCVMEVAFSLNRRSFSRRASHSVRLKFAMSLPDECVMHPESFSDYRNGGVMCQPGFGRRIHSPFRGGRATLFELEGCFVVYTIFYHLIFDLTIRLSCGDTLHEIFDGDPPEISLRNIHYGLSGGAGTLSLL